MTSSRMFWPVPLVLALVGCDFSTPIGSQHPSIQRLPGSLDATPQEQEKALFTTARVDLGCERVELVATLPRKYVNSTAARYVVEGCDKRALYVEVCESYPSCRYLAVSVLDLTTLAKGAPAGSGAPATLPVLPAPSARPASPTTPSAAPAPAPAPAPSAVPAPSGSVVPPPPAPKSALAEPGASTPGS